MPYKDTNTKREYNQQWHLEHKEEVLARKATRYQERRTAIDAYNTRLKRSIREFIQQQKVGRVCARCGISDIRVLDFHHIDRSTKEGRLSQAAAQKWSKERILREIAKCETLCANCHRILHWEEQYGTS
jgi:hypothetical protein